MPVKFCDRIEINPAVCHGKPVVRGTRVMVSQVLGALSGGDSIEDVLVDYPSLSSEDLSAVFAADLIEECGHEAVRFDVVCNSGDNDDTVFAAAQRIGATILTSDRDCNCL